MKTLDDLHPIRLYGSKEIFRKHQDAGCTETSFGRGEWIVVNQGAIEEKRIVGIFVFFYPNKVETLCSHKVRVTGGNTMQAGKSEESFSLEEFESFLIEKKISLAPRCTIAELMAEIE